MKESRTLNNKIVLITGGGTGIGRAIAFEFAKRKAFIVINYLKSESEATYTVRKIKRFGARAIKICADITKSNEVRMMFEIIDRKFGHLDILVNNAGWTKFIDYKDVDSLTEQIYDRIMNVNLKSVFLCSTEATERMRNVKDALIINIASISAFDGRGSNIAYCAAKAAVVAMTKSFALAFGPNIRVNAIAPGFTDTRFIAQASKEFLDREKKLTPLRRIARPQDIAKVAVSLYEDMKFVNGQTIIVDGGRLLLGK